MDSHVAKSATSERQGAHQRVRRTVGGKSRTSGAKIWRFTFRPGPRLGNVVIEAEKVSKAYGDQLLVEDMTFALPPGGIVGVIGPNGAGKTTLFRMITGQEKPDSGQLRIGETVSWLTSIKAARLMQTSRFGKKSPVARHAQARQSRGEFARIRWPVQFLRLRSAKESRACCQAENGIACIWPRC